MANFEETGNTSNSTGAGASISQEVDANPPLYIYPSDTQGSILISTQLIGSENYSL